MNHPNVLPTLNLVYILVIHWDTNKKEIFLQKKTAGDSKSNPANISLPPKLVSLIWRQIIHIIY